MAAPRPAATILVLRSATMAATTCRATPPASLQTDHLRNRQRSRRHRAGLHVTLSAIAPPSPSHRQTRAVLGGVVLGPMVLGRLPSIWWRCFGRQCTEHTRLCAVRCVTSRREHSPPLNVCMCANGTAMPMGNGRSRSSAVDCAAGRGTETSRRSSSSAERHYYNPISGPFVISHN